MEQLGAITTQLQLLSSSRMLWRGHGKPSPPVASVVQEPSVGRRPRLPAVSDAPGSGAGLQPSIAQQLRQAGPPPRTKQQVGVAENAIPTQGGEEPNELLLGDVDLSQTSGLIVNALSKQSSALTALVAHISAQGDNLLDFSSSSQSSSAMKGVQKRERLQAELAQRSGNFFLLLITPNATDPQEDSPGQDRSKVRRGAWRGTLSQLSEGVRWVERPAVLGAHSMDSGTRNRCNGPTRSQRGEGHGGSACNVCRAGQLRLDWTVAYLISLLEEPPIVLFQERTAAIMSTGRPFAL